MVAAARPGGPEDAVLGFVPRLVLEPATVEEAGEALSACARDRLRVLFVGGGTDLELGRPPEGIDAVLRTARLSRVVEHAPADQIVVAEAGLTLAELQRHLAPHGQRLALDPPLAARATVGGAVAANAFGPRRCRYGASRDLVVGMTFVRADGTVAKGGGKVVKNVAGFDVPRLLVGSLGTLALIGTVTFRLHPSPETEATVAVAVPDAAALRALVAAAVSAQLEPVAFAALARAGGFEAGLRFEGFAPGVAEGCERLDAAARALGLAPARLDGAAAAAFWAREEAVRAEGAVRARLAAPPAALAALAADALRPVASALGAGARASLYPSLGLAFASGTAADAPRAAAAIEAARAALRPLGGHLVLAAAPPPLRALADPWGPPPGSLEVMRRLKARLDPERSLAPGRFVGGI
jgi:glycolate dehydrogenase FAD-binding subunit